MVLSGIVALAFSGSVVRASSSFPPAQSAPVSFHEPLSLRVHMYN